jgi:hypothetical protein
MERREVMAASTAAVVLGIGVLMVCGSCGVQGLQGASRAGGQFDRAARLARST